MEQATGQAGVRARRPAEETRRYILDTASRLFYTRGVRAVGMDTLLKELGLGSMTLYRQFPTKDDLVAAYIQAQSAAWWARLEDALAAAGDGPRARLAAVFAQLDRDIAAPGFRGCPFLNTVTEFPDPAHPAHAAAVVHKRAVRARFEELARAAGAVDPTALTDALVVLMDGAYCAGQALGPDGPARRARALADDLVDGQCPSPSHADPAH